MFFRTDGNDPNIPAKCVAAFHDGELKIKNCLVTLPPSKHPDGGHYEWIIDPFHRAIPIVYNVADAGLMPPVSKTGLSGARAQVLQPCQSMPTHFQEGGAQAALFRDDGTLDERAFDDLLSWTLPTGFGQREYCLWKVARSLKSLDETRHLRIDELEPIVRRWHQLALPNVKTKEWYETWGAFARCWERVTVPLGEEGDYRMTEILDRARRAGCPRDLGTQSIDPVYGLAAAICRELARESDNLEFYLDCRVLGRLCGVSFGSAAGCLRALAASRVIAKVKAAEKGKATEYRYLRTVD